MSSASVKVVVLTPDELRALIREEIERAVRLAIDARPPPKSDRWTDVAGIAKQFKCSPRTVYNWIKQGAPAHMYGPDRTRPSLIRIDIAEFEAWANKRRP